MGWPSKRSVTYVFTGRTGSCTRLPDTVLLRTPHACLTFFGILAAVHGNGSLSAQTACHTLQSRRLFTHQSPQLSSGNLCCVCRSTSTPGIVTTHMQITPVSALVLSSCHRVWQYRSVLRLLPSNPHLFAERSTATFCTGSGATGIHALGLVDARLGSCLSGLCRALATLPRPRK